jgi:hypothetical protein
METPYNKQYEVNTEVGFEPLMPKVAEKLHECGNEMLVIDIEKVMMGE